MTNSISLKDSKPFKILSLDGGRSKGTYSLGVLLEIEKRLGAPLYEHFDYFYGCSTGAIITSALAMKKSVADIKDLYITEIPKVMKCFLATERTWNLREVLQKYFGKQTKFDSFTKHVGIVATMVENRSPRIFKTSRDAAFGRKASFIEGFGCTIAEATLASCAANPFFNDVRLYDEVNKTYFTCRDGGYCANNPTLFAIIDALKSLGVVKDNLIVVNIGTGDFPRSHNVRLNISGCRHALSKDLILDMFDTSSNTNAAIVKYLLDDIKKIRISDSDSHPSLKTNILEHDKRKLEVLFSRGRESFGSAEKEFKELFPGSL